MADMLKRLMTVEVKEVGNRILEMAGSTEDKDRMGDIIRASGWKLKNFKLNPVFLWVHDYSQPPIGRSLKVWVDKETNKLMFRNEFAPPEVYEFADTIYKLYLGGFLHATSVGFIPLDWEGKSEEHPYPKWEDNIYTSQELLELSAVPVPANANALVNARDTGVITIKEFETMLDRERPEYYRGILPDKVEPLQITGSEKNPEYLAPDALLEMAAKVAMKPLLGEEMETVTERPYKNEHACRLRDPADFDDDSFRRTEREHEGKKYSVISGKLEGETTMTEQAYRYAKDTWTAGEARTHCKDHDGKFEAATTESAPEPRTVSQEQLQDDLDYLYENIMLVGLNEQSQKIVWEIVRAIMRLTGNDIPDDILRQVEAVIGEKREAPPLISIPDPLPDPKELIRQRAVDVAEVADLVVAKLKGKRIPK